MSATWVAESGFPDVEVQDWDWLIEAMTPEPPVSPEAPGLAGDGPAPAQLVEMDAWPEIPAGPPQAPAASEDAWTPPEPGSFGAGEGAAEWAMGLSGGRAVVVRQDAPAPDDGVIRLPGDDAGAVSAGIRAEMGEDALVLRGLAILDTDTATEGVQLDAAALAQLAAILSYETGDFGAAAAGDGRLSWAGGEALLLDWEAPADLAALLASGDVLLL